MCNLLLVMTNKFYYIIFAVLLVTTVRVKSQLKIFYAQVPSQNTLITNLYPRIQKISNEEFKIQPADVSRIFLALRPAIENNKPASIMQQLTSLGYKINAVDSLLLIWVNLQSSAAGNVSFPRARVLLLNNGTLQDFSVCEINEVTDRENLINDFRFCLKYRKPIQKVLIADSKGDIRYDKARLCADLNNSELKNDYHFEAKSNDMQNLLLSYQNNKIYVAGNEQGLIFQIKNCSKNNQPLGKPLDKKIPTPEELKKYIKQILSEQQRANHT